MLKRTMTYQDLDGNNHTEDFYFSVSKREAIRLKMINSGMDGLDDRFKAIIETRDPRKILDTFEDLVTSAYGRRSEDGRSFIKKPEWTEWFVGTDAYTQIFEKLVTDAGFAVEFVRGVLPAGLPIENIEIPDEIKQNLSPESQARLTAAMAVGVDPGPRPAEELTVAELQALLQKKTANS